MITNILLYVVSFIVSVIGGFLSTIARGWTIWPSAVLDGLTYFFTAMMNWDFAFNIATLLTVIKFIIGFDIMYVSVKLLLKLFNYIRGAGGVELN